MPYNYEPIEITKLTIKFRAKAKVKKSGTDQSLKLFPCKTFEVNDDDERVTNILWSLIFQQQLITINLEQNLS